MLVISMVRLLGEKIGVGCGKGMGMGLEVGILVGGVLVAGSKLIIPGPCPMQDARDLFPNENFYFLHLQSIPEIYSSNA